MDIRFQNSPRETRSMETDELRANFHFGPVFKEDGIQLLYSHYDRLIIGGIKPVSKTLQFTNPDELRAAHFLERREMGVINVGGKGFIKADGKDYEMDTLDCLYIGSGTKEVHFQSSHAGSPALFYILSAPAHHQHPTSFCSRKDASPVAMGETATSNKRTIYKYIHPDGVQSCQLVMGLTVLDEGSVWNSIPPHTHTRRSEVYFYFNVPDQHRVFHFMGEPQHTRHLVISNHEAVISPPWSVHYGCGTSHYGFIWGMAGENRTFTDMDQVPVAELK